MRASWADPEGERGTGSEPALVDNSLLVSLVQLQKKLDTLGTNTSRVGFVRPSVKYIQKEALPKGFGSVHMYASRDNLSILDAPHAVL